MEWDTYTTQDIREIMKTKEKWEALEHDKWKLLSFSENEARFGWLDRNLQYTKYITVRTEQAKFFRGVEPDVLDML